MKNEIFEGRAMRCHGFALSVFSRKSRAQCIAVDLVRTALKVGSRQRALRFGVDQAAGLRRRMAAAFGGYLVTEQEPAFSERRADYAGEACFTVSGRGGAYQGRSDGFLPWVRSWDDACLDAPEWLPGGGALRVGYGAGEYFIGAVLSARGGS